MEKEDIKKNVKLLNKIKKELEKNDADYKKLDNSVIYPKYEGLEKPEVMKLLDEYAEKRRSINIELEKIKNDDETLNVSKNIIYNNFNILLNNYTQLLILNTIKNNYNNKNIGEAAAKKLEDLLYDAMMQDLKDDNFKIYVKCSVYNDDFYPEIKNLNFTIKICKNITKSTNYLRQDYYYVNYNDDIFTLKKCYSLILKEVETRKDVILTTEKYNISESYNSEFLDEKLIYIEPENIKKEAKKLITENKKALEKIKKLEKEAETIRYNFNNLISGSLQDSLYIKSRG